MKEWKDERIKGWKNKRIKGWKDERMKGWTNAYLSVRDIYWVTDY